MVRPGSLVFFVAFCSARLAASQWDSKTPVTDAPEEPQLDTSTTSAGAGAGAAADPCSRTMNIRMNSWLKHHELARLADSPSLASCSPASITITIAPGVFGEPERTERSLDLFLQNHFAWTLASFESSDTDGYTYTLSKPDVVERPFLEKLQATQYPADRCRAIAFKRGQLFIGKVVGGLAANMFTYADSGMP